MDDFFHIYSGECGPSEMARMAWSGRMRVKGYRIAQAASFMSSFDLSSERWIQFYEEQGRSPEGEWPGGKRPPPLQGAVFTELGRAHWGARAAADDPAADDSGDADGAAAWGILPELAGLGAGAALFYAADRHSWLRQAVRDTALHHHGRPALGDAAPLAAALGGDPLPWLACDGASPRLRHLSASLCGLHPTGAAAGARPSPCAAMAEVEAAVGRTVRSMAPASRRRGAAPSIQGVDAAVAGADAVAETRSEEPAFRPPPWLLARPALASLGLAGADPPSPVHLLAPRRPSPSATLDNALSPGLRLARLSAAERRRRRTEHVGRAAAETAVSILTDVTASAAASTFRGAQRALRAAALRGIPSELHAVGGGAEAAALAGAVAWPRGKSEGAVTPQLAEGAGEGAGEVQGHPTPHLPLHARIRLRLAPPPDPDEIMHASLVAASVLPGGLPAWAPAQPPAAAAVDAATAPLTPALWRLPNALRTAYFAFLSRVYMGP